MGLLKSLDKLINGDSEKRKIRREVEAETKVEALNAYREQYKASLIDVEKKKAATSAKRHAQGNGGLLDSLGKIGEGMNAASKGLVEGIEINPNGADEVFRDGKVKRKHPDDYAI